MQKMLENQIHSRYFQFKGWHIITGMFGNLSVQRVGMQSLQGNLIQVQVQEERLFPGAMPNV